MFTSSTLPGLQFSFEWILLSALRILIRRDNRRNQPEFLYTTLDFRHPEVITQKIGEFR